MMVRSLTTKIRDVKLFFKSIKFNISIFQKWWIGQFVTFSYNTLFIFHTVSTAAIHTTRCSMLVCS